jgi:hypothetical protein
LNKKYSGIGSRKTPILFQYLFQDIGSILSEKGFLLRSGHAFGADFAFELGASKVNGKKEIFIPWKGYNNSTEIVVEDPSILEQARKIAESIHPFWNGISTGAKHLHTRNIFQITGSTLNDPVDFVLCWTQDSSKRGGTRTAIIYAEQLGIPVYDFGNFELKFSDELTKELRDFSEDDPREIFQKYLEKSVDIPPLF